MARTVTGARTYLDVIAKACKLSHMPGFVGGLQAILGTDNANEVYALWTPFCSLVEGLIAADNWFNQIDYAEETAGSEDLLPPS